MKKSKFTESQIIKALKENEAGRLVEETSRELSTIRVRFIIGVRSMEAWKLVT